MSNSITELSSTYLIPEIKLDKTIEGEVLLYHDNGYEFRKEYQSQCINSAMDAIGNKKRYQFHIGCGGGKTDVFLTAILYNIVYGKISKVMLSAPRLALLSQHIEDIEKMIMFGKANNVIPADFILDVVEISSRTISKKQKDELEKKGYEVDDGVDEVLDEDNLFSNINYIHTSNIHSKIEKYLKSKSPVIFVGCIPSVMTVFVDKLNKLDLVLDVLVNDEYHNLINQNKNKKPIEKLQSLFTRFHSVLNFSATPKKGKLLSSSDEIFGTEVARISTPDLRAMNYLKKHFKVYFIASGYTLSISDNEKYVLEQRGIKDVQQFYKEMNIILQVIKKFLNDYPDKQPHVVTATSRIAVIEEIFKNAEFKEQLYSLIDEKTSIFNTISGSTKTETRKTVFDLLRKATKDVATLTMQHSVMSEGINVTNFATCIIMRGMNEICLNQFINRITRKHDDYDTAEIYVQMDGNTSAEYKRHIKRFLAKLMYFGLTLGDIECELICYGISGEEKDPEKLINVNGEISFQKVSTLEQEVLDDIKMDAFKEKHTTEMDMEQLKQYIIDNVL